MTRKGIAVAFPCYSCQSAENFTRRHRVLKQQVSPGVIAGIVVVVVLILGYFAFKASSGPGIATENPYKGGAHSGPPSSVGGGAGGGPGGGSMGGPGGPPGGGSMGAPGGGPGGSMGAPGSAGGSSITLCICYLLFLRCGYSGLQKGTRKLCIRAAKAVKTAASL